MYRFNLKILKPFIMLACCVLMLITTQQTARAYFRFSGEKLDRIEGWFFPAGIAISVQGGAVYYGAEISIVNLSRVFPFMWLGAYADYSTNSEEHQFSIGPEFGWLFYGFDIGYLGFIDEIQYYHGFTVRCLLSVPLVRSIDHVYPLMLPYVRYSCILGYEHIFQFGVMIKVAVKLD